jgi:hypothetical protein
MLSNKSRWAVPSNDGIRIRDSKWRIRIRDSEIQIRNPEANKLCIPRIRNTVPRLRDVFDTRQRSGTEYRHL